MMTKKNAHGGGRPAAVARTLSLFDGQTDFERGSANRDGLPPTLREPSGTRRRARWKKELGAPGSWTLEGATRPASVRVDGRRYVARVLDEQREFATIADAATWAELAAWRRGP